MTITPLLADTIAGRYAKLISDGLYLDKKDSLAVLYLLEAMERELRELLTTSST